MSRTLRRDIVRGTPLPKKTKKEMAAQMAREIKRRLIKHGLVTDPSLNPPKYEFHWALGQRGGGIVKANTAGEGRGLIKAALGLRSKDTLPSNITIVRVTPSAATSQRVRACEIVPVSAGSDSDHLRDDGPVSVSDGPSGD